MAVVWINGAFGAGKTSVAKELISIYPNACLFDPELIGSILTKVLPQESQPDDYQDLKSWRHPTYQFVRELQQSTVDVRHFTLLVSKPRLLERISERKFTDSAKTFAVSKIRVCTQSLEAPFFSEHIDANLSAPKDIAETIAERLNGNE